MPRTARKKSESGIYHIMVRGVNKQEIFGCEYDYNKYIKILYDCKEIDGFELYAYCLMNNHVHLLIKEVETPIETIMKRIGTKYVQWFNLKYDRVGHLFQDRYKSEPVEDDSYFLTVLRYIHQNPVKAGLCKDIAEYNYSSFNLYAENADFIDSAAVFELVAFSEFGDFNRQTEARACMDISQDERIVRKTDEDAYNAFVKITGCHSADELNDRSLTFINNNIKILSDYGLSVRQISELTGVGTGVIRKIIK